jgi:peptidoglycan hydrolase-like protein with peptidoglycan-binding domain
VSCATGAAEPLSSEVVRTIQGRLRTLGFYSGQIDGIWGPSMQSSIKQFQQGRGLQATGQLNPATTTALGLDPNNLTAQTLSMITLSDVADSAFFDGLPTSASRPL